MRYGSRRLIAISNEYWYSIGAVIMSDKKNVGEKPAEIAIIDERTIRDKIYEVRGVKVMLDF